MLDAFYISCYNYLKPKYKRNAIKLALLYITFAEITLYSMTGMFFMAFAHQMHILDVNQNKIITIVLLLSGFIYFKNWMQYNGKRRNILNAKSKSKIQKWKLILFPITCIILGIILYQAI